MGRCLQHPTASPQPPLSVALRDELSLNHLSSKIFWSLSLAKASPARSSSVVSLTCSPQTSSFAFQDAREQPLTQ